MDCSDDSAWSKSHVEVPLCYIPLNNWPSSVPLSTVRVGRWTGVAFTRSWTSCVLAVGLGNDIRQKIRMTRGSGKDQREQAISCLDWARFCGMPLLYDVAMQRVRDHSPSSSLRAISLQTVWPVIIPFSGLARFLSLCAPLPIADCAVSKVV